MSKDTHSNITRFSPELCDLLLRMDPTEFEGPRANIKAMNERLGDDGVSKIKDAGYNLQKFWNNHKGDPEKLKRWAEEGRQYRATKAKKTAQQDRRGGSQAAQQSAAQPEPDEQQPMALAVAGDLDDINVGIGCVNIGSKGHGGINGQVSVMAVAGGGGVVACQDQARRELLALAGQGAFTEGEIGDKYAGMSFLNDDRGSLESSTVVKLAESPHMAGLSIGSGMFGHVSIVTNNATGEPVAVKTMKRRVKENTIANMAKEIFCLRKLQHNHVVVFYDAYLGRDKRVHIVMELCPKGCLKKHLDHLPGEGAMTSGQIQCLLTQIGSALAHIHEMGYVHRDVKPGNIFLRSALPSFVFVLGDFGTSRFSDLDVSNMTMTGSLAYMGPEMLRRQLVWPVEAEGDEHSAKIDNYNKNDVYALGVCAAEAGVPATLRGANGIDRSLQVEAFIGRHPAGTIVPSMTRENPFHRPNAAEVVRDLWVTRTPDDQIQAV